MRRPSLLVTTALAGCASGPPSTLAGPRNVGAAAPQIGGARKPASAILVTTEGTSRPHTVLEIVTTTARQITLSGRDPTRADPDDDLRKCAAELDAGAAASVRQCGQGMVLLSWSQIAAKGQAVSYTGQ